MGNVQTILSIMRKFTPKGQGEVLQLLIANKTVLSRELGFAELPTIIAGQGKTVALEKELFNNEESVRSIVTEELKKLISGDKILLDNVKKLKSNLWCAANGIKFQLKYIEADFADIKTNLLSILEREFPLIKDYSYGKKTILQYAKESNDAFDLRWVIRNLIDGIEKKHELWFKKIKAEYIKSHFKHFDFNHDCKKLCQSFEIQQASYLQHRKTADDIVKLLKAIVPKTQDIKVIEYENKLMQKYNLDFIRLYDMENAQKAEAALELCAKKGVQLPKSYIVTPLHFPGDSTAGEHFLHTNGSSTVVIHPSAFDINDYARKLVQNCDEQTRNCFLADTYIDSLNQPSTNHPLQEIVHEILHGENNWFGRRNIPKKFEKTIDKLTNYAKENATCGKTAETVIELRTEEVINGILSSEKKQLSDYIARKD